MRNRGELAEGWYDPATLKRALASTTSTDGFVQSRRNRDSPDYGPSISKENSDEDVLGPTLPSQTVAISQRDRMQGPGIPNMQDLELQQGKWPLSSISWSRV